MLDACDFGISKASEFYEKYVSQGRWTRCLHCMREAGMTPSGPGQAHRASDAGSAERPRETVPHEDSVCKRCIERDDVWKQSLTLDAHGCSACKNVFDASSWDLQMIKNHRHSDRDLVCPGCAERGYAPGRYDEYQCEECLENFGSLKFNKHELQNAKRRKGSSLACEDCRTELRCSKCHIAFDLECWSKTKASRGSPV